MSYNKELRTHNHQGRSEPEEVGILTRCVSALLQAAGLFNTPLRGSRHSDLVLQPVTSTTAKWEPIHAGARVIRASERQELQWEWGSTQQSQAQPGILLSTGQQRKAGVSQQRSSVALAKQLLNWVIREWRNAADPRGSDTWKGHATDFVLGEVNVKALD